MPVTTRLVRDETPTEKIVRESNPKKTVKDSKGRTIVFQSMSVIEQARLYRAVGAPHTSNEPYMRILNVAAMVKSIDGDIGPQPTTLSFAEMRMDWLGDEGFVAVLTELNREAEQMIEEAQDAAAKFRDEVKN